jgi:hypothetical protein
LLSQKTHKYKSLLLSLFVKKMVVGVVGDAILFTLFERQRFVDVFLVFLLPVLPRPSLLEVPVGQEPDRDQQQQQQKNVQVMVVVPAVRDCTISGHQFLVVDDVVFCVFVLVGHYKSEAVLRLWLQAFVAVFTISYIDGFGLVGGHFQWLQDPGVTKIVAQVIGYFRVFQNTKRDRVVFIEVLHHYGDSVGGQSVVEYRQFETC